MQKVFLASDHAGFKLKENIASFLKSRGYEVEDLGNSMLDKDDDYPDFISKAAEAVSLDPHNSKAVIFGGSGQAEAMVANKFKNVRCALFYGSVIPTEAADITGRKSEDPFEMIRLTREHNNSNVLSIGARFVTEETAQKAIELWISTPFTEDERHVRRINKIFDIESRW